MRKIVPVFQHSAESPSLWCGKVISALVLVIIGILMFEVIMRYVFNSPTKWCAQTALVVFIGFVFLSMGFTTVRNEHVRVDVLYSRLSPKGKAILDVATFIVTVFFLGVLIWQTVITAWTATINLEEYPSVFRVYIWPAKIALALGLIFVLLTSASQFLDNIRVIRNKNLEGTC